mgnify:CR=1 FL=1
MTEHSPTPWKLDTRNRVIIDAEGGVVCAYSFQPDAERIILCVNANDELVAALERCKEVLGPQVRLGHMPIGGEAKGNWIHAEQALGEVLTALAKARGEKT